MKKLTLTFCAFIALLVVAPAIFADDGPERYSGKEKEVMQPAPPVCDFYRAHEWDLGIWGAFAFGSETGQNDVPDDDPFVPDTDPFLQDVGTGFFGEPQIFNPNERVNIGQVSRNQLFARDDAWGGGVDAKYFWSRYFGVGVEAVGLSAKTNFAGGALATFTGRFPFGRFAPYVTGGLGFIDGGATTYKYFNEQHVYTGGFVSNEREFWTTDPVYNHHIRLLGQIGVGLEYRLTCHIGLMADFTWNFVFGLDDHSDKFHLLTEQGTNEIDFFGIPITQTVQINQAIELRPGHGSDNQDFGMVRFGVTFSY